MMNLQLHCAGGLAALALVGAAMGVPAATPLYTFCETEDNDLCVDSQLLDADLAATFSGGEDGRDCFFVTGKLQEDCVWGFQPKCAIRAYGKPLQCYDSNRVAIPGEFYEPLLASSDSQGRILDLAPGAGDRTIRLAVGATLDALDGTLNGLNQNGAHGESGEVTIKLVYDGLNDGPFRGDEPDDSYVFKFGGEDAPTIGAFATRGFPNGEGPVVATVRPSDAIRVAFVIPPGVSTVDVYCCNDTGTQEVCYDVDFYTVTNLVPNRSYCLTVVGGLDENCEKPDFALGWFDKQWQLLQCETAQANGNELCVLSDGEGAIRFGVSGGAVTEELGVAYRELFPFRAADDTATSPLQNTIDEGWRGFYDGMTDGSGDPDNRLQIFDHNPPGPDRGPAVNSFPFHPREGNAFWSPQENRILMLTEEYQELDISDVRKICYDTKPNTGVNLHQSRVAVSIEGQWFISDAFSTQTDFTVWQQFCVYFDTATWQSVDVDLGQPPQADPTGNTGLSLPSSGQLDAFGVFLGSNQQTGNFRFDNYTIYTVEREPRAGDCNFNGLEDSTEADYDFTRFLLDIRGQVAAGYRPGASTKDASADEVTRYPRAIWDDEDYASFFGDGARIAPEVLFSHGLCAEYCIKVRLAEHVDPSERPTPGILTGPAMADLNTDEVVNASDLALLLSFWGAVPTQ